MFIFRHDFMYEYTLIFFKKKIEKEVKMFDRSKKES